MKCIQQIACVEWSSTNSLSKTVWLRYERKTAFACLAVCISQTISTRSQSYSLIFIEDGLPLIDSPWVFIDYLHAVSNESDHAVVLCNREHIRVIHPSALRTTLPHVISVISGLLACLVKRSSASLEGVRAWSVYAGVIYGSNISILNPICMAGNC